MKKMMMVVVCRRRSVSYPDQEISRAITKTSSETHSPDRRRKKQLNGVFLVSSQ